MKVLLTSGHSQLARIVSEGLAQRHELRLTDRLPSHTESNYAYSALGHDLATELLVNGMDAVVHVGEPLDDEDELAYIDYMTRCTYNLCVAMSECRIERLVLLSTLGLMSGYDARYRVTEQWRPVPTDDTHLLGKHLAETVCKEFAREHKLSVVVLRIGQVGASEGEGWLGNLHDDSLLSADFVQAVELALACDVGHWSVFHITSAGSDGRYSTQLAQEALGYEPSRPAHSG